MKKYLGLDNIPILNGEYKILKPVEYFTELIGIANYKEGVLHGQYIKLNQDGLINEIEIYDNGNLVEIKSGVESDEYVSIALYETQTSKREGKYILHTHNETSIFSLKNGMFEENKWIFNDNEKFENPILLSIENFKENHHIGEQVFFHEDGTIMLIEYYRDRSALPEKSTWFDYDENGKLIAERNFRKNKKDGRHIFYNENGNIIREISYRDGRLFGPSIYYKEDGTKLIIDYEFGSKIGERIE